MYYASAQLTCVHLSHFSHVWIFETSWTVAHQAPLNMRFSRQEYWKWKWKLLSVRLFVTRMDLYSPWNCPGQNIGVAAISSSRGIFLTEPKFNLPDWTRVSCRSCIAGRFFTPEPPGKPLCLANQPLFTRPAQRCTNLKLAHQHMGVSE